MELKNKDAIHDYYYWRKKIQELYIHDTYYGDLIGEILKYRDENKFVESISIDMSIPKIEVELADNSKLSKTVSDIESIIRNYLHSSISQLNLSNEESASLDEFINTSSLYDSSYVGNMVIFLL